MLIKKLFIFIIFYMVFLTNISFSNENKILFKLNNEIITTIDILNEIKYLSLVSNDFKNSDKNLKIEVAKNSLVKEKIKKIGLNKLNINFQIKDALFEEIIKNNLKILNIKTIDNFNLYFEENNLNPLIIREKISTDIMWKQYIYNNFKQKVKIDEKQIEKNILNKKIQKEYLLSEILIEKDIKKNFEKKLNFINKIIQEKNFSAAALKFSISDTSKIGGKLGWIRENVLNKTIKNQLNLIKIGEITNPIPVPGGFLILKMEDVKETEIKLDLNKEIKNIIDKQTNEQLSMFSNIYFNKLKKNIDINEF